MWEGHLAAKSSQKPTHPSIVRSSSSHSWHRPRGEKGYLKPYTGKNRQSPPAGGAIQIRSGLLSSLSMAGLSSGECPNNQKPGVIVAVKFRRHPFSEGKHACQIGDDGKLSQDDSTTNNRHDLDQPCGDAELLT